MELIIILVFLLITFFSWKYIEKKHYKRIAKEEEEFKDIMIIEEESLPAGALVSWWELVIWSVVLGADYFRHFVAWLIHLFGWRLSVYESLLDRARREAINRAKKICKAKWYNCLTHLRYETTVISNTTKKAIPKVEVFVYADGTTVNL